MSWRPLPLGDQSDNSRPCLLILPAFTADSYSICITDLTHLWQEQLPRREVITRAFKENTAIDPSEDRQQMQMLLDKLQSGLAGAAGTSLTLDADGAPDVLRIDIEIELPSALGKSLTWPVMLKLCQQPELTAKLVLPLIAAQHARLAELNGLMDVLRDKDHVIQKLVDKLEATGAELGHVFAGAAIKGGKKASRKYAEDHVKGLRPFEHSAWKADIAKLSKSGAEDQQSLVPLVSTVFGEAGQDHVPVFMMEDVTSEAWWQTLRHEKSLHSNGDAKPHRPALQTEATETAFQVQGTPPQSQSQERAGREKQLGIDLDTEDDEDLDVRPSQKSVVQDSLPVKTSATKPIKPTKKIGKIGGRKSNSTTESPSALPELSDQADGEVTTGGTDVDDRDEGNSMRSVAEKPKKKVGIGKIGGSHKKALPPEVMQKVAENDQPRQKLGHIGHKPPAQHAAEDDAVESASVKASTPEPVETEEEKADRRRAELKREMEDKAHRAPTKKKRKF